jgi:hypothetical protein
VVDQVLITERNSEDALADKRGHRMLDPLRGPRIAEAGGEPPYEADGPVRRPEQQGAGVRGDRTAVEAGDHGSARDRGKVEQGGTVLR